jgi:hypothetical protein
VQILSSITWCFLFLNDSVDFSVLLGALEVVKYMYVWKNVELYLYVYFISTLYSLTKREKQIRHKIHIKDLPTDGCEMVYWSESMNRIQFLKTLFPRNNI